MCNVSAQRGLFILVAAALSSLSTAEQPTFQQPGKPLHDAVQAAIDKFRQAIDDNPDDPTTHVGLAESYIMLWCFGFAAHADVMPAAEIAAQRAAELDPQLAAAHTTLGVVQMGEWNWRNAEHSFRRAVALAPDDAKTHHWLALFLSAMGRHEEALVHSRRAAKLAPTPGYQTGLGAVLYFARDFPQMIQRMEATVSAAPDFAPGYDWLGMAYVETGRFDDALRVYKQAVELSGNLAEMKAGLGHAHGLAGNRAEAEAIRDELDQLSESCHIPPVQMAFVQVSLGEHERAIELLQRGLNERAWEVVFIRVEPWLDPLRSDPTFVALEQRLRLPSETGKGPQ